MSWQTSAAQSAPAGERDSYWFSLLMNCAAELETASYCMTDTEAKRVAQSGADYYRDQARAAWQRTQAAAVPKGWSIQRVFNPSGYTIQMPDGGFLRITDFGGGGVETAFAKFICAMLANAEGVEK